MNQKRNICLMYAIALLQGMVFYGPIATLYRQASGVSVFQIALIESISYILSILFEVPWGIVADKIGYKKTFCFCCGLYFVSKLVFWTADGFADFLLERVMLSVVLAGLTGVDTSILYLSCEEEESQKVFGTYNSLETAGLLIAALIFSAFVGADYRAAAFLTVMSYGLAAVLSFFLTEVKGRARDSICLKEFRCTFWRIVRTKPLMEFLIAVALMTQTHQTVVVFLNQLQYMKAGLSASRMGIVFVVVTLSGIFGVFSGRLTQKYGVKRTGTTLLLLASLSALTLAFTSSAVISVSGILLLNLGNSFFQPLQTEQQNKMVRSKNRATELSIYAIIIDTVCAGTSVLFGVVAKASLEAALLLGAALSFTGLMLFLRWCTRSGIPT